MSSRAEERAERIAVLKQDLAARDGGSYAEFAQANANDTSGGRFNKIEHLAPPTVIKGPTNYPPIHSGPWSARDPSGDEPPLGFDVNALD
jgi:hypothetical protein